MEHDVQEEVAKYGHHPDPLIDAEVELDRLEGVLSECWVVIESALTLRVVSPRGTWFKNNVRRLLQDHGRLPTPAPREDTRDE
jgi:hypothetical protein